MLRSLFGTSNYYLILASVEVQVNWVKRIREERKADMDINQQKQKEVRYSRVLRVDVRKLTESLGTEVCNDMNNLNEDSCKGVKEAVESTLTDQVCSGVSCTSRSIDRKDRKADRGGIWAQESMQARERSSQEAALPCLEESRFFPQCLRSRYSRSIMVT